ARLLHGEPFIVLVITGFVAEDLPDLAVAFDLGTVEILDRQGIGQSFRRHLDDRPLDAAFALSEHAFADLVDDDPEDRRDRHKEYGSEPASGHVSPLTSANSHLLRKL